MKKESEKLTEIKDYFNKGDFNEQYKIEYAFHQGIQQSLNELYDLRKIGLNTDEMIIIDSAIDRIKFLIA